MEYVVLGLLMLQSMTIYELNQAFKGSISMFYSASYGSLQNATKKLLSKELITASEKVENGRNKKIYTITPAGQEKFQEWMLDEINPKKLETIVLSKVSFLGLLPTNEQKLAVLDTILTSIDQIDNELKQTQQELSQLQPQLDDNYQTIFKYQVKPLDYGIRSHHMARKWVQEMIDELK